MPMAEVMKNMTRKRAMPMAGKFAKKAMPTMPIGQQTPCTMPRTTLAVLAPAVLATWWRMPGWSSTSCALAGFEGIPSDGGGGGGAT
eukprot:CAMPEP_0115516544 /NCGR_PEP_ID=MMETSP0271-20121206/76826_1 /TAXON_ID=71861 /ORGANISM="Scrippsiella trochoidea, Strain CCMP3099" /LENGTH=86 /DNA_ID=CAMNT_0002947229 /DNA_START=314 /DNA_END=571 /DNA_ORIENTATION=-